MELIEEWDEERKTRSEVEPVEGLRESHENLKLDRWFPQLRHLKENDYAK